MSSWRAFSVVFLTAVAIPVAAHAATSHDGVWIVDGTTDVGTCAKTFHGAFKVEGDAIAGVDAGAANVVGYVDASGEGWARLTAGSAVARAQGKFKGTIASGAWSSNTNYCGGRWHASRAK
jgi:hypothetical protein